METGWEWVCTSGVEVVTNSKEGREQPGQAHKRRRRMKNGGVLTRAGAENNGG